MNIIKHKQAFENRYNKLGGRNDNFNISFPLVEIDRFDWKRGPWLNEFYSYYYRRFSAHVLSGLSLTDNQKVLVVGCGFGFDEKNIKSLFNSIEIWSIDISEEMLKLAIRGGSPSRFSLAIAENLPFSDNSFDRVISREVIEHVMEPQLMLKEIYRVLKPDGVAVVTTENEESFGPTNYFSIHVKPKIAKVFQYDLPSASLKDEAPTRAEIKSYISIAGLSLKTIFYDGALYKYLPEMATVFKSKLPVIAHYFSCLENNPKIAAIFCDQVKYILKKNNNGSHAEDRSNYIHYACIRCKNNLIKSNKQYECSQCGQVYPLTDKVPNFVLSNCDSIDDINEQGKNLQLMRISLSRKMANFTFIKVNALFRKCYIIIFFSLAMLCSIFIKKNKRLLSYILTESDPYQKYLKI